MRPIVFGVLALSAAFVSAEGQDSLMVKRDIEYAQIDGHSLKLDLYVPAAENPPPLVVWVHGGGWRGGSRDHPRIGEITRHGFALASISYRFTPQAIFPAQIHDCKAAIRWLRANAEPHGYDPRWIAVAGSSAGGHLALLLGVSGGVEALEGTVGDHLDQSSTVQAAIDYFGPSDFVLRGKTQPERAYTEASGSFALLGGLATGQVIESLEVAASPVAYLSADDPPLLVFHGRADRTVLLDQSEQIVRLYRESGLPARLVVLEKAGHGGKQFFRAGPFQVARSFLQAHRPDDGAGEPDGAQ